MNQGEVWLVNLDPTIGSEMRKTRPCVIINDDAIGVLPLKIISPITDFKAKYARVPWMVVLEPTPVNYLSKKSVIDLFQVRSVSEKRLIKKIGNIDPLKLDLAFEALKVVFGMR